MIHIGRVARVSWYLLEIDASLAQEAAVIITAVMNSGLIIVMTVIACGPI